MLSTMNKALTVPSFVMTVVDTEDENPEGLIIGPDRNQQAKTSTTESVSTVRSKMKLERNFKDNFVIILYFQLL